ncbi:MAG TPA: DUF2911 domain-containing protein, partial [Thermoanaerobaculia bacterium]|nr:DUF2911 domain-containing protein [Thermoanaerobaculia bacterium]
MRKTLALTIALTASAAFAEIKLPEASPNKVITQEVGVSKVTIDYHRPAMKGRKIWGDLVPIDKVWRLGANNATTIELSHAAKVNGFDVPAGKYALFAIPKGETWTMILSKKPEQWGSYAYKAEDDQLRFGAKVEAIAATEWFDIDTVPVSDKAVRVEISWDKVRVPFTIEFDTPALVWKQIDEKLASPAATWDEYLTAARYAMSTNTRFEEGLQWVDEAMRRRESFWNYELKGLMLHKLGRDEEAAPLMYQAAELAKGKAPQEYVDNVLRE